ncbi:Uu.00g142520.m01.CDS01 [Anthostomella pinea]|uniref:Uu.00g142520.m01.CDS01 n=1 Tax=Anthostomella pinea TaxID=933095 RepID=A0AAI8YJ67_9PEZI|nr:Uu.00g142520.m01.CDS01 [Anthostomella pinea]
MAGLPDVPGSKLYPFNTKGKPLNIEYLEELGHGLHGYVWKVRINDQVFALKIFNWFREGVEGSNTFGQELDFAERENYFEPFQNECRAYGRLKEFGWEDLTFKCFGYILLEQTHLTFLKRTYENFYKCDWDYDSDEEYCRKEPVRAIVKEFVDIPKTEH